MHTRADRPPTQDRTARQVVGAFALRSALVIGLLGVLAHLVLRGAVVDNQREALEFHAQFVAEMLVAPALDADGVPTSGPAQSQLADALAVLVEQDVQVLDVAVVDADGGVVATGSGGPGTVVPPGYEVLRTRVPLGDGLVADVVQDRGPTDLAAAQLVRRYDVLLLVGLLGLWAALLPLALRLVRRLAERGDELLEQQHELALLLDREQQTVSRLEELARLKDGFLSAVSHELRTPLTIVAGTLETLQRHRGSLGDELRGDLLDRAAENAARLDGLVGGLLELHGSEVATVAECEQVDLAALVTDALAHLPPVEVQVDLAVQHVVGDRKQLGRVVSQLLGNAVRHGDPPVRVETRRAGAEVDLVVSDRGPGVPPDLADAVFEPFRQGPLRDAHSPGTGIGLALVARFVAAHGGHAWVDAAPGGGAAFHVRIPDPHGVEDPHPSAVAGVVGTPPPG